ncbi:carbon-nitrogen hydrolase [Thermoactinomyces intermedius]|jgi:predicted amidohydrolase|uniref:Acyltransferase n=1 Tax=Thermoactinomyces intermedius TaxID=2024 RepID=A0A8I1DBL3_THEIN|nr:MULTISPECIES: nitrilase-related carbon-nitrogen hydrolase [Thermoactinomyces]MBA4548630.1 carbon-nitrogen hydrolase [Thermoactinomyces intermedius]MBA4836704.1 carbon-nitrogen hydrolase [Thermoactinomyces intermedius]MBH8594508.1 acyltransferase [Thermoactinomyces intermedius]MBH8601588.1 acyltransferase [Thermoactinomyces sp. CICC 23799]
MRVGLAQIRPRLGRVDLNLELHEEMIHRAREEQVDLLVFPELSLTGYQLLDLTYEMARDPFSPEIQGLIRSAGDMDLVFGFVEHSPEHILYNSAIYATAGNLHYLHRKVYLPTYGMFDEARYFGKGEWIRSFPTRFGQFGLLICEDVWHSSAPYLLTQDGAQVMIVLSNAPVRDVTSPVPGSKKSWDLMLRNNAVCHGSYMIYCNRVGTEDGVTFFGGSQVVDPFGEVEAQAELFTEDLIIVDLDLDKIRKARFQLPVLRDENLDLTIRELNRIRQKRTGGGS